MTQEKINKLQNLIKKNGLDGWLFYDFRGSNDLALSVLEFPAKAHLTRRFFYFIPAEGIPQKVAMAIELHNLAHLPGDMHPYSDYNSLNKIMATLLKGVKKVAMEYSPKNAIPYLSKLDAGTYEYLKDFGIEIVSSGDLLTEFTAVWTKEQYEDNIHVAHALTDIVNLCWKFIKEKIESTGETTEYEVQKLIMDEIEKRGFETDHEVIVGVNGNGANPHYSPTPEVWEKIHKDDFVLIDLWAKPKKDNGVWADITWVGYVGTEVPERYIKIFNIVKDAREAAFNLVSERFKNSQEVRGWEVDDASRKVIADAGYAEYFVHRTGHSITTNLHGTGPHNDNFETQDMRLILPGTSFSIEPGIYLKGDFGVRSEIDVYIHADGRVEQTGGERQWSVVPILK
ncbi:MAG: M24 family metallopeptidase [Ignavibacteriaceae bacterium]|nr:M24 family metallopeptidase [Ignavibacteriaceae bacterium]